MNNSYKNQTGHGRAFKAGLRNGLPIGLGYLAVSFALGIAAKSAGLTAPQATLASALCNASAGEFAGFTVIASNAPHFEIAIITFVVNARYLLMSAALSQKVPVDLPMRHRLGVSYFITDEIFGASIAWPGELDPFYTYGLAASSLSLWALGTCLGTIMGNVLPTRVVTALGVLLYGMFLAIIIPPAKRNIRLVFIILIAAAISCTIYYTPLKNVISSGFTIIIAAVAASALGALLFPMDTKR